MTAFLLAIGSMLVAQVAADDNAALKGAAAKEAVQKAIGQLGDEDFAVREAASKFLWKQGLAAKHLLILHHNNRLRES